MLDHVLKPGVIGGLRLPNRVVMGAMHLNLETRDDSGAALAAFYAERARGGAGLIVTGGSAVSRSGAGGPGYSLVNEEAHHPTLRRAAQAVHAEGGHIALQLFHAGRYASASTFGLTPVAPSPLYSRFSRCTPRELPEGEVWTIVEEFALGAARARELGYDAVEVMASEGYLINQFTAPATNQRQDAFGGDAERRRRFPVEVLRAVRQAVGPDFPLLFRLSGADLVPDGTPHDDVEELAVALAEAGADALDVGVGWHEARVPTVQAQVPPGTWARYAGTVKKALCTAGHAQLPVVASNRINRLSQADEVLGGGDADFVSMARPFLADPAIVEKSRAGSTAPVNVCIACNEACIDRSFGEEAVSCLVNPRAGQEVWFPEPERPARPETADPAPTATASVPASASVPADETASGASPGGAPRRYAVLGAGPAGLEAARALARLGHHVEVFEAASEAGGQFRMARQVPGKAEFGSTVRYYLSELERLGVRVRLAHRVGLGDVPELRRFDGAVLATGVLPRLPELAGYALGHVRTYQEAFADPGSVGSRVAIVGGGGIAVDLAHLLLSGEGTAPADGAMPTPSGPPASPASSGPSARQEVDRFLRAHGLADEVDGTDGQPLHPGSGSSGEAGSAPSTLPEERCEHAPAAREVALLRRGGRIGAGIGPSTRWVVVNELRAHGARLLTGMQYHEITRTGVLVTDGDGATTEVPADTVVLATGQEPNSTAGAALRAADVPYETVGGAASADGLNAVRATAEALTAAHRLARRR